MLSQRLASVAIACSCIIVSSEAYGFDPMTIGAVVSTAASTISVVTEVSGEVAGAADAFTDLYSEIDSDAAVSEQGQKITRELREIEGLAREVGYTKEEIDELTQTDRDQVKSLTATLRMMTRAVRTGKKVASLFTKLEKKAQLSQLESLQVQKEQLRVQYRQLNEQLNEKLSEKKKKLEAELSTKNQIRMMEEDLKQKGAKSFGSTGILSFPKQDRVLKAALKYAERLRPLFFGLILLVFFLRVISYQFSFEGSAKYGELVRDAIITGVLLAAFPQLIGVCISVTQSIAETLSLGKVQDVTAPSPWPGKELSLWKLSRDSVLLVEWLFSLVRYVVFLLTDFLFNWGMAFLVILFPPVIFASRMLRFTFAWPILTGAFLLTNLWPFFWNVIGLLAAELWNSSHSFSDQGKTILFSVLQLASPLIFFSLLRGRSPLEGVSQATGIATKAVSGLGAFTAGATSALPVIGTGAAAVSSSLRPSVSGLAGRAVGQTTQYGVGQLAGRTLAATNRTIQTIKHAPAPSSVSNRGVGRLVLKTAKEAAAGFVLNDTGSKIQAGSPTSKTFQRRDLAQRFTRGLKKGPKSL